MIVHLSSIVHSIEDFFISYLCFFIIGIYGFICDKEKNIKKFILIQYNIFMISVIFHTFIKFFFGINIFEFLLNSKNLFL